MKIDRNILLRRPLTRRSLTSIISSLKDDILLLETSVKSRNESIARYAAVVADCQRSNDNAITDFPKFLLTGQAEFRATLAEAHEIIAGHEADVRAIEATIQTLYSVLAEAEELLPQMPD